MPSLDILLSFALATFIFAYMPGPALLYTVGQTIARGRTAGLKAALGLHIGGYVHVIAATLGLSAIFNTVPELYTALKIGGAVYLIYLGVKMMWPSDTTVDVSERDVKSSRQALFESITVEVINPKTAIFFIAFLPQFVDPAASLPLTVQFFILGVIINVAFSSADIVCVFAASTVVKRLRNSDKGQRLARFFGGTILVGLGLRLALDRQ